MVVKCSPARGNNAKIISRSPQCKLKILQCIVLLKLILRVSVSFITTHVMLLSISHATEIKVTPRLQQRQEPLPTYVITSPENPPRLRDL